MPHATVVPSLWTAVNVTVSPTPARLAPLTTTVGGGSTGAVAEVTALIIHEYSPSCSLLCCHTLPVRHQSLLAWPV